MDSRPLSGACTVATAESGTRSPVAGDRKIYLFSEEGKVTIASAEDQWKVLSTADLGEPTFATPAIADNKLYVRTAGQLYCFGVK